MERQMIEMNLEEAAIVVREAGNCEPDSLGVMLWSSPGFGKTSIIKRECDKAGAILMTQNLSQSEPTDLLGVPFPDGKIVTYKVPYFWFRCSTESEDKRPYWLFFDDIVTASEQLQACLFSWVLERKNDLITLRDNVRFVLAGNRVDDMSAANSMPKALANRLVHINVKPDVGLWLNWALDKGIDPWIVGFIRRHHDMLNTFDPKTKDSEEPAFATPRTWEMLSKMMVAFKKSGTIDNTSLVTRTTAGIVGMGVSTMFMAFVNNFTKCVPPEEIVKNPKGCKIPDRTELDLMHATVASLEHYLNQNPKYWREVTTYALRLVPDIGAVLGGCIAKVIDKFKPAEKLKVQTSEEMLKAFKVWGPLFT